MPTDNAEKTAHDPRSTKRASNSRARTRWTYTNTIIVLEFVCKLQPITN